MTATAPELSKSDFFDFVTSNEVTDAQYKQQMRSVNVFMESPDSRSNPLLSEEPKEQNNNSLLSVPPGGGGSGGGAGGMAAASTALQSFDSIWNTDRDRGRLESAMLEDLSKYYWTQDGELGDPAHPTHPTHPAHPPAPSAGPTAPLADTAISNKLISNNTDGQIYTLTVLNQDLHEPPARYWPVKEEELSLSSPAHIDHNPSLDLDSILNMDTFSNNFSQDSLSSNMLPKVENFSYDEPETDNRINELSTNNLIKIEPYTYEDNEFQSSERIDDTRSPLLGTSMLESTEKIIDNNNDWRLTDQNTESTASLLRRALQGKASLRYSTIQKGVINKLNLNTELKRVIIDNNNKTDVPSMYEDSKEGDTELLMISPPNGNVNISILLEDTSGAVISSGEPSSAHSVDDLLFQQLDTNYPGDYEKLKRIASELTDEPYCTVEALEPARYNIHHVGPDLITMIPAGDVLPQHLQVVAAAPAVSSTKPGKKYKRVQSKTSPPPHQHHSGTAIQPATSTSNGIRKERSLHYCSICSKGFKDKYSVNVHVRTHTGEKPFACSLCGKSFRQKAHLAKHYQTHIAQKTAAANGTLKTAKQQR